MKTTLEMLNKWFYFCMGATIITVIWLLESDCPTCEEHVFRTYLDRYNLTLPIEIYDYGAYTKGVLCGLKQSDEECIRARQNFYSNPVRVEGGCHKINEEYGICCHSVVQLSKDNNTRVDYLYTECEFDKI